MIDKLYDYISDVKKTSEFYKKMLKGVNKDKGEFGIEDFKKIPFTTANDIKRSYPFGMIGCDKKHIVEMFEQRDLGQDNKNRSTRINGLFSDKDIEADINRKMKSFNISEDDVIYFAAPYDCSSVTMHLQKYANRVGAMSIYAEVDCLHSGFRKQIDAIIKINPSVIVAPNFNVYMTVMKMLGIQFSTMTNLRMIVLSGMPVSGSNMKMISRVFGDISVVYSYDRVEFGEIAYGINDNKLSIHEDYYVELINPKTTEVINDAGVGGEIVITGLNREGMPLIRYRTGEIGKYLQDEAGERKLEVLGDFSNLIEFKKNNKRLTMIAFEDVLFDYDDFIGIYKMEFVTDETLKITVEMNSTKESDTLAQSIQKDLEEKLGIDILVEVVPLGKSREDIIIQSEGTSVFDLQEIKNKRKKILVTY